MRTASCGGSDVLVEEAPDVGVAGRVDVDRERRLRLFADVLKGVVDERSLDLGGFLLKCHRIEFRLELLLGKSQ